MATTVPPTHITILDDMGAAVTDNTVGPYQDGSTINLTCMSSGGKEPNEIELQMNNSRQTLAPPTSSGCVKNLDATGQPRRSSSRSKSNIQSGCLCFVFQVFRRQE